MKKVQIFKILKYIYLGTFSFYCILNILSLEITARIIIVISTHFHELH